MGRRISIISAVVLTVLGCAAVASPAAARASRTILVTTTIQAAVDAKKLDAKATVDAEALIKAGVIRRAKDGVRLLADGDLKAKLAFDIAGASKAAIEKVEKDGGSVKLPAKAEATE